MSLWETYRLQNPAWAVPGTRSKGCSGESSTEDLKQTWNGPELASVSESQQLERQRNERFFSNPIGRNAVQRPALLFMENSNGIEAPVWPCCQTQGLEPRLGSWVEASQIHPGEDRSPIRAESDAGEAGKELCFRSSGLTSLKSPSA